jgi:hypothetical protein
MSNEVTYKYVVFEANQTMIDYLTQNSLGIQLFEEGRANNCKKLSESIVSQSVGNVFTKAVYALLTVRTDNSEYNDVMSSNLQFIEEFENSDDFLRIYTT